MRRSRLIPWLGMFVFAALIGWRVACSRVLVAEHDVRLARGYYARLPVFILLDALGRGSSLVDLALRSRRCAW